MVWGLFEPRSFGEYWPDGEFENGDDPEALGWGGRLDNYYSQQSPEVQRELYDDILDEGGAGYGYFAHKKFVHEIGTTFSPSYPKLNVIRRHEAPQTFDTVKSYKNLGSYITLNSFIAAVDEGLKAAIETLEPDVHQFFPLEIRMPKGKVYPVPFFTLVVGQYFDSFSLADCKKGSAHEPHPNFYRINDTKKGMAGVALRKSVFGNAHLWRERGLRTDLTCFSDELHDEIAKAELNMPRKFYPMMEV